jgi:L-ascorbate metabolism protein UlaG (beta-lactamase superfamily)
MKAAADNLIKALSNLQIRIKYIGNSFFYITFANGTRLVTDPYGPAFEQFFGPVPEIEAEVITISHYHVDHTDGISAIKGSPLIIKPEQVGKTYTIGNLKITGFYSNHVADMGINIIYVYEADGFKIVHMGETDQIISPGAMEAVKDADVILAYAGQYGGIKNKDSFASLFKLGIKTRCKR